MKNEIINGNLKQGDRLVSERELAEILDTSRKIGVTLNDSLLMSPSKSVTAVFGIREKKVNQDLNLGISTEKKEFELDAKKYKAPANFRYGEDNDGPGGLRRPRRAGLQGGV